MFISEAQLANPEALITLLRSAYTTSQADRKIIQSLLDQKIAYAAALPDEIVDVKQQLIHAEFPLKAQLSNIMKELVDTHHKLIIAIDHMRSLISPIKRLSPELLSLIFTFALSTGRFVQSIANEAPLSLCGVSLAWRLLVIASPLLWQSIAITFGTDGQPNITAHLLRLWLQRSGGIIPLDVSLSWLGIEVTENARVIWELLICNVHRWRHLKLNAISLAQSFALFLEPYTKHNLELKALRSFRMLSSDVGGEAANWISGLLHDSNQLKSFKWCDTSGRYGTYPSLTSFGISLTSLSLDGRSSHECLHALSACLNLERCRLRMVTEPEDFSVVPQVVLRELLSLELHTKSSFVAYDLFHHLTLPQLDVLWVTGDCFGSPATQGPILTPPTTGVGQPSPIRFRSGQSQLSPFQDLLTRSKPPLKNLHLHPNSNTPASTLLPILSNIPSLVLLHLGRNVNFNGDFLEAFVHCPKLSRASTKQLKSFSGPSTTYRRDYIPPWCRLPPCAQPRENERIIQILNESFKDVGLISSKLLPKSGTSRDVAKHFLCPHLSSLIVEGGREL